MKFQGAAAFAALCVGLSGCATIVDGVHQSVSVSTTPVEGAACTLTNSEGTWYLTSPGNADVHKTKNNMTVDCTKDGYAPGHTVAISQLGVTTAGNILLGGVIGLGVDAASGADYHYDAPIIVPLGEKSDPKPAPAPSSIVPPNS